MNTLHVDVVSAEELIFSDEAFEKAKKV